MVHPPSEFSLPGPITEEKNPPNRVFFEKGERVATADAIAAAAAAFAAAAADSLSSSTDEKLFYYPLIWKMEKETVFE